MNDTSPFGTHSPTGLADTLTTKSNSMPDTWFGRRKAYILRRIAMIILRGKPVDVERFGAKMRLYPYQNICEKRILFTPQYFDSRERNYLESFIANHQGILNFIDIGANVGAYSLFAATHTKQEAKILAVEPQPEIFNRLVYNIQQNSQGSIKAVSCAIADKKGELTLFLNTENHGQSSVKIVETAQASSIRVPAITLMDLLEQEDFDKIDAIKLDVEGAEDLILEPFFRTAPDHLHPRLIIIEDGRNQWQTDIPHLLTEKGYILKAQTRLNLIYEKKN